MSGFILGTGSGILASAAVYYTLSSSLTSETSDLRSQLHNASHLLASSLDPQAQAAAAHSSLVGPSSRDPYPAQPFSSLLREKWNLALSSAVEGVRTTDWSAVGAGIYEAGQGVMGRIAESTNSGALASGHSAAGTGGAGGAAGDRAEKKAEGLAQDVKDVVKGVKEEGQALVDEVKGDTQAFPEKVKDAVDGIDLKRGSIGTVGGNAFKEQVKRNAEEKGGRLV